MITPEDIELIERDDMQSFRRVIGARLRLNYDVAVTEFAVRSSRGDAVSEARRVATREIWNKVYGDFIRELHRLRVEISRVGYSEDHPAIKEQFDKIYDMLRLTS